MSKAYIIDAKDLVLFMLSINPSCQKEFDDCVSDSNINKEVVEEKAKQLQKEIISHRTTIYVTPQILAEFSNWLEKYAKGKKYIVLMKEVIGLLKESSSEHYVKMENILQEENTLIKFGFTDTSIQSFGNDRYN